MPWLNSFYVDAKGWTKTYRGKRINDTFCLHIVPYYHILAYLTILPNRWYQIKVGPIDDKNTRNNEYARTLI